MNNNSIEKPWWREGVLLSAKVSAYIAVPIIIASFIGKYLDKKYNTDPYIFFITIGLAFLLTIFMIWREVKKYKKSLENEE